MNQITKRQFDAYCFCREPRLLGAVIEVEWFASSDINLLGIVIMDRIDREFNYVLLGRDRTKLFRGVTLSTTFFRSADFARVAMLERAEELLKTGKTTWSQKDELRKPSELFVPRVVEQKMHPYFKMMAVDGLHEAAQKMLQEIAYAYVNIDGDYIKEFQTTDFDARLWELYLYVFLHTEGYIIDRSHHAPDYFVNYGGTECAIEAVTVNPGSKDEPPPMNENEVIRLTKDYMPIRWAASLRAKVKKEYWRLPHVAGKPLVIAIHDFHQRSTSTSLGSMIWPHEALVDYLYGRRVKHVLNSVGDYEMATTIIDGEEVAEMETIGTHSWNGKVINSNFFEQPHSENISAVLFSNSATLSVFNRMGKLAGFGNPNVKMIRHTLPFFYDEEPIRVQDIDDPGYEEAWGDGLIMYHNPNARHPVREEMFPSITHIYFDKERSEFRYSAHPNTALQTFTEIFIPKPE